MSDHIITNTQDGIQRIEIRRPERKNALTIAMYGAFADALKQAEQNPAVRVIFIHGQQGIFTSGNDVRDFLDNPPASLDDPVFQFLRALIQARKPVIASVSGDAVGVGTTMLLHCDYVIADECARFSVPFSNLGVCPEAASSLALPLLIGWRRATELLMFGAPISAHQASDWGLINRVVRTEDLSAEALKAAHILGAKPVAAMLATKTLLREKLMPLYEKALADEAREFHTLLKTQDSREAFRAFLEKRAPVFEQVR
jgi:enoyl-CoA hydratase/carnithine racemase